MDALTFSTARYCLLALLLSAWLPCAANTSPDAPSLMPEQPQIDELLAGEKPEGIMFLVMEHDSEALQWVLPRIVHYTLQLRSRWTGLAVIVLSHGDEMFALQEEYRSLYPEIHHQAKELVEKQDVLFLVCGAFASLEDVPPSAFPKFVDVVPFGPAEIENYRNLDYTMISVEQTW